MDKLLKALGIKAKFFVTRDEDGNYVSGQVFFTTTTSKELVKELVNRKLQMPTVNCSRDGSKCPTPIGELQIHNHHVPIFTNENELINYAQRIVNDVGVKAEGLGFTLNNMTAEVKGKPLMSVFIDETASKAIQEEQDGMFCENCDRKDLPVDMYEYLGEQVLCQVCAEVIQNEADSLAQQAHDKAKDEGKYDDNLPY